MTTIRAHFDGKVIIPDEPVTLPKDTPLFIVVSEKRPMTGRDIVNSGFAGLWKDRQDIGDSVEYARKLRRHAETRGRNPM